MPQRKRGHSWELYNLFWERYQVSAALTHPQRHPPGYTSDPHPSLPRWRLSLILSMLPWLAQPSGLEPGLILPVPSLSPSAKAISKSMHLRASQT